MRAGLRVRLREERDEVRAAAVRDVRLRAVDDVVVAVPLRDGLDARDVTAGVRLAHAERDDLLASERGLEELLDLLLRTEVADDRCRHVALDEEAHRHARRVPLRELFGLRDAEPVVAARSPVLLRVVGAEETELASALEDLVREDLCLLPFVGEGRELLLRELTNGVPELIVLFAERAGHLELLSER